MKKKKNAVFFVKLISLILVISAVIGIANHYYVDGYYYKSVYSEIDAMYDVPYGITMTNVGTSHGLCSFQYPESEKHAYNLALSGSDIYHNFATIKQFSDHFEKGCIIAIPTSYFSFCMPTDAPSQKRYYLYLDKKYIIDFNYETLINAKYIPVLRSGEFVIKDLIKDQDINAENMMAEDTPVEIQQTSPVTEQTSVPNEEKNIVSSTENKALHEALYNHAVARCTSWRLAYMTPNEKYMDENTQLLIDMVNYCKENGFKPVLVTTPIYFSLNDAFADGELDKYYFNNVRKAAAETDVPYLDLSHDEDISCNPEFFGNSDHMSDEGADVFYGKYKDFLKGEGYIAE